MNILIVDDSEIITDYLRLIISEYHSDWIIDTATTTTEAKTKATNTIYDLFILDYELDTDNEMNNGYNLGLFIKQLPYYKNTPIIFETKYPEHIYEVVNNLNCIYYLLKPFNETQVLEMLHKIFSYDKMKTKFIFSDIYGIQNYIYLEDIIYIKSNRHLLNITTNTNTFTCTGHSLESLANQSNGLLFRCHKSYLINIIRIMHMDKTTQQITLVGQSYDVRHTIPIGRKYYNNLLEKVKK